MEDETEWDDFSKKLPYRNLALEVGNKIFWISREGLAELSSTFKTRLYSQDSETFSILLVDKKPSDVLEWLRCMFRTGDRVEPKEVDENNVNILLQLADEYGVGHLKEKCTRFFMRDVVRNFTDVDEKFVDVFRTAVKYKLKVIVRAMFSDMRRFGMKKLQPFMDEFPVEVRAALLTPIPDRRFEHDMRQVPPEDYNTVADCPCTKENDLRIADVKCGFCGYATCTRHFDGSRCAICHECGKAMQRAAYMANTCQCIDTVASDELKKAGL